MPDRPRIVLGTEVEYRVSGMDRDQQPISPSWLSERLFQRALRRPHLPGAERSLFLAANGTRCLVEPAGHASHFEVALPETRSPFDAVRYELAGDRLVAQLAQEVAETESSISRLWVTKHGVDYLDRTTCGAHENYLVSLRAPHEVRSAIVSHCVSRIVFAGAGGFDERGRFVLSPRATFIRRVAEASSPDARALVDTRDEPHGVGYHRLHLLCGDHLRGHLANVLRLGTTALVVALADAGCMDPDAVQLASPLDALETINHDDTLTRRVALVDGRAVTAVEIQRHYLERALRHLHLLPAWAVEVCNLWADVLARLSEGPHRVVDRLDWSLKWMLFRDRVARRGGRRPQRLHDDDGRGGPPPMTNELTSELYELDLRFAQLYPPSLFDELAIEPGDGRARPAWFRHRVRGVDDIDCAMAEPPRSGRATVRAAVIRRLAGQFPAFTCTWDSVRSPFGRLELDLSDPFVEAEVWKDVAAPGPGVPDALRELLYCLERPASITLVRLRQLAEQYSSSESAELCQRSAHRAVDVNNRALELRDEGRLEEAEWLLRIALAIDLAVAGSLKKVPHRRNNLATVLLMQGRLNEAREELVLAWQLVGTRHDLTSARILTVGLAVAFLSGADVQLLLGQLKTHLAIQPLADHAEVSPVWRADAILRALALRLDDVTIGFLRHLVAVLNRKDPFGALDRWSCWREVQVRALDIPSLADARAVADESTEY